MQSVTIRAYAKINLDLYITGQRQDGYHEISTRMHSIDLYDQVNVEKISGSDIILEVSDKDIPEGVTNTAFRAALLMRDTLGTQSGYKINIIKNIPSEAGLGGSSADAAAVVRGINILEKNPLDIPGMYRVGAGIGADVPFMITGGCAVCKGIGDIIEHCEGMDIPVLLVKPQVGVSTAWAYKEFDRLYIPGHKRQDTDVLYNDLEAVACSLYPVIGDIKESLISYGASGALMTGSGSCVYGLFSDMKALMDCKDMIEQKYKGMTIISTRTLSVVEDQGKERGYCYSST